MENIRYGSFWRRFLAFMIDKTIVYALSLNAAMIVLLLAGLGGDFMPIFYTSSEEITAKIGAIVSFCLFLSAVIDMLYFTWFVGISGQTPGKMLLRLRIVSVSGGPITPGTAFLRWTGYLVSGLFFFLGFFWIALDHRKQGWHDKIALTLVIRTEKAPAKGGIEPKADDRIHHLITGTYQNTAPLVSPVVQPETAVPGSSSSDGQPPVIHK